MTNDVSIKAISDQHQINMALKEAKQRITEELVAGNDIIVKKPSKEEMFENRNLYDVDEDFKIKHSVGIQADVDAKLFVGIQQILNELKFKVMHHYQYHDQNIQQLTQNHNKNNQSTRPKIAAKTSDKTEMDDDDSSDDSNDEEYDKEKQNLTVWKVKHMEDFKWDWSRGWQLNSNGEYYNTWERKWKPFPKHLWNDKTNIINNPKYKYTMNPHNGGPHTWLLVSKPRDAKLPYKCFKVSIFGEIKAGCGILVDNHHYHQHLVQSHVSKERAPAYECKYCNKKFSTHSKVRNHEAKHRQQAGKPDYVCQYKGKLCVKNDNNKNVANKGTLCDNNHNKGFVTKGSLWRHIQNQHHNYYSANKRNQDWKDEICQKMVYESTEDEDEDESTEDENESTEDENESTEDEDEDHEDDDMQDLEDHEETQDLEDHEDDDDDDEYQFKFKLTFND